MREANVAFAWMAYLLDPCKETIDQVVIAVDNRPDMPITGEQTRAMLTAKIDEIKALRAATPAGQTSELLAKLMKGVI